MSNSRSDSQADVSDPLRPSDHADGIEDAPSAGINQPKLGFIGWLRWGWRQLTSMRTALVLLLLLAIAAIPGSVVPQRGADPNGVTQYRVNNPDLFPILDRLQMFDVYTSAWFSAIYILLFISLIGCVIPRTKHHWKALRSRPPRTPVRLSRLDDYRERSIPAGADAAATAAQAIESAQQQLRKAGYRVERYDQRGTLSVSAERGYLRETGNLVFHMALVGLLVAVGVGGGLTYSGQTVIREGNSFVNSLGLGYTSFNPGRFVDADAMPAYTMTLNRFDVQYAPIGDPAQGMSTDFAAQVTVEEPGEEPRDEVVRVNYPLNINGEHVYLMGNGYAPMVTVRNGDGDIVFSEAVEFLPQDNNLTSLGVIKVADGFDQQMGLVGFFYPTAAELATGAYNSAFGDLVNPLLTLEVYLGDLGIDDGTPRSVYTLDTSNMTQIAGRQSDAPTLELAPGETAVLPDGLGSVTFEDATNFGGRETVTRFVSLTIQRDVGASWVLAFSLIATAGVIVALYVPRRRMWVKAVPQGDTVRLEYAGLARGEDPAIAKAVDALVKNHATALGVAESDDAAEARSEASDSSEPSDSSESESPAETAHTKG